jgi:hypothetical protein
MGISRAQNVGDSERLKGATSARSVVISVDSILTLSASEMVGVGRQHSQTVQWRNVRREQSARLEIRGSASGFKHILRKHAYPPDLEDEQPSSFFNKPSFSAQNGQRSVLSAPERNRLCILDIGLRPQQ